MKKKSLELEAARKKYVRKNNIVVSALVLGAGLLCVFLGLMQNYVTEANQRDVSKKILDEVTETLDHNDKTVKKIEEEFDELNTTTLKTLHNYIEYIEIFDEFNDVTTDQEAYDVKYDLSLKFESLAKDISADNIYLVDQYGEVMICSQTERIGTNMFPVFSKEELATLLTYTVTDGIGQDGTTTYGDTTSYSPIVKTYEGKTYYTYSCYYGAYSGTNTDYFLLTSVNTSLLDEELASIKQISSVLDGVSVGQSGFLFSLDTSSQTFSYFKDNNGKDLTDQNYTDHGVRDEATKDNYSGYQVIDGVRYYCVTQEFHSSTYGDFTVIAAVVAADELLSKIATTVGISCFAFVIVSAIIIGYGMIIRRDIADHTIQLEEQFTTDIADETEANKIKFNEEEIQERVKIRIEDSIERNTDKQLSRINIGTRNAKGVQRYISKYMIRKISPVMFIGIGIVFGISFFSQTLLAFQEAISVSEVRIKDVQQTLEKNETSIETIHSYINEQYLSKSKLISYLIEEEPEYVLTFDPNSEDVHPIGSLDEYGNPRYSIENSKGLQSVCDLNNLEAIYIYDEYGQCIATNSENWYYNVNSEENARLSKLSNIISGRTDHEIEDVDFGGDEDITHQYIAYKLYYYTYSLNGKTYYTSKANYLDSEWNGPKITKHRSTVQVDLSIEDFQTLFEVTKLSYVLNNLHVYGEESFFVAFDTSEDHICIYSPNSASIGKSAKDLGLQDKMFKISGTYNGFTNVNGVDYYQSCMLLGDYYFATAIPTSTIYSTRDAISAYTLLFASIFIIFASSLYTISSDRSDMHYLSYLKLKDVKEERKTNEFMIKTASGVKKTSTVSSRYTKILWKNKTVEQKLSTILMGYLFAASVVVILILLNILIKKDSNSIFTYIFSGEWDRGLNIFSITAALMILVLIIAATNLVKFIVKSFCGALGARVETLGNLLVSVVKYGGFIGGLFYVLYLFGFDTTSLLTSAGILTVVVGLGAQSLISDIIAGMFIVFEGEFRVGDIVTIQDFRGQVLEIGLRTTKLMDISNNIKIFNNSAISGVLNMTKESSFAFITVGVEYGESLERVESVLNKGFPQIKKKLPAIVEGPFYKGVLALNNSSVDIGIVARCSEQDRVQLARDLNREVFLLFKKNNINIPFPQVTLSYLEDESHIKPTLSEIKEGSTFAEREKEASKGIKIEGK